MNKLKTAKVHLLKFLFILPMLVVLLLAFRPASKKVVSRNIFTVAGIVIDYETMKPVEGVTIGDVISGKQTISDDKGYYALKVPVTGDSLKVELTYAKQGYVDSKKIGGLKTTNPFKQNDIIIIGITKDNSYTYLSAYGAAKRNDKTVNPDYEIVYEKYLNFLDSKRKDAEIGNSPKPIHIINGIPYAIGNGSKAWFHQEEVDASPECKVWADGKIMTIEEANNKFNRFEVKNVGAVPRNQAKEIFGIDCNILILMKDSSNPIQHSTKKY